MKPEKREARWEVKSSPSEVRTEIMTENPTKAKIDCKVNLQKVNKSIFVCGGESKFVELSVIIPQTIISIFTNITLASCVVVPEL